MDVINWQPGEEAKGIVDEDGHVHVWSVEDYEVHNQYVNHNPSVGSPLAYFEVEPDGSVDMISPNAAESMIQYEAMIDIVCEADPHFHNASEHPWTF
jgi:hypothetical protein